MGREKYSIKEELNKINEFEVEFNQLMDHKK